MWLLDESCEKVVRDAWLVNKRGSLAYSFVQKCRGVKQDLRTWNRNCFGHVQQQIKSLNDDLRKLQESLVNFDYPPSQLLLQEKEIRKSLEDKLAKEELLWAQKARQLWLVEGDRNTKYFHSIVKKRRLINHFTRIRRMDGEWTNDYQEMEMLAVQYFNDVYTHDNRPARVEIDQLLHSLEVPSITDQERLHLEAPLTDAEIENALFLMKPDKAPGPDGLPAMFFQRFSPVVKNDLISCIKSFFDRGFILKELNQTMITLIPKNQSPEQFKDFRPISLCNVVVKIISKVLVIRMQSIMERIIAPNQNGFVKGRAISYIMIKMAFPHKIIQVIMQCVTTVSYSLMLNGQQAGNFQPQRGIRQGDPLSPYLFLLCSNILSCMLHKEERMNKLQGIQFGRRGPRISHLMYADDTILFFKADPQNCSSVKKTLDTYARIMSATLGAKTSNKLGKYLGVKVDNKVNSVELYKELVEKLESKLAGWKSRLLSQSGRLTLIQSVLQSSPIYQLSVMHMPNKYADKIDALSTNFYWGHNSNKAPIHLASRKKIFRSKDKGGLGLRQTSLFNKALLAKQVWHIVSQPTSIYSKWACAKYFKCNLESPPKKTTQPSAIWKCIDKSGKLIFDNLWWSVGSGAQIPLGSKFWWPLQATLTQHSQQHTVANMVYTNTRAWNHQLVNQLFAPHIARDILQIPLSVSNFDDRLSWKFSTSGEYKVSEGYHFLSDAGRQNNPSDFFPWKFLWSLSIPSRVKKFVWRILNDALPNLTNLKRHHMPVEEICYLCQQESESLDHIFITCPFARAIWLLWMDYLILILFCYGNSGKGYDSINTMVFESRGHHQIITKNQSSGHAILQKDILLFIKQRNIRTTVMAIADRDAYKSYVTSLIPQNIFLLPTNSFIHL
ncbi:ribonuclease H [Senna tora]|uniref:Ribonuclease H n=1 Tax=Senna tora TaxID=362788 RepID=A0A834W8W6_9FABA|nr:ribonuclease H [Senna tora]